MPKNPFSKNKIRLGFSRGDSVKVLKKPLSLATTIWFIFIFSIFILSGRFWLWNIFSLIPAIALIPINLLLLAFWLKRFIFVNKTKNTLFIIVLLFITFLFTLNLSEFNFRAIFRKNIVTKNSAIKLFNWNTEFWHTEAETKNFYKFLKEQGADIYHLQERILVSEQFGIYNPDDFKILSEEFEDFEIIKSGELITITKLPVINTYKPNNKFLRADIDINNQIVSFYNVHIPVHLDVTESNPIDFVSDLKDRFYWREDEFEALLTDIENNSNPIVISGDFNTTKSMNRMNQFKAFEDSQSVSKNIFPATWSIFKLKLWRIDYILGKEIQFINHQDINPGYLSDHWGQLITLTAD